MDLVSIAKIIEISPVIGLTIIFSFVLYKVGTGYINFVNKILEKYSEDVKNLKECIDDYQKEDKQTYSIIITKIDNFRQMVLEEFEKDKKHQEHGNQEITRRIDDLYIEILKHQINKREEMSPIK